MLIFKVVPITHPVFTIVYCFSSTVSVVCSLFLCCFVVSCKFVLLYVPTLGLHLVVVSGLLTKTGHTECILPCHPFLMYDRLCSLLVFFVINCTPCCLLMCERSGFCTHPSDVECCGPSFHHGSFSSLLLPAPFCFAKPFV